MNLLTATTHRDKRTEGGAIRGRDLRLVLGGGSGRVLVLPGARLARASRGFYQTSCHSVQAPASGAPRFSWAFFYTSNCCAYESGAVKRLLEGCGVEITHQFGSGGYPRDTICRDASVQFCFIPKR